MQHGSRQHASQLFADTENAKLIQAQRQLEFLNTVKVNVCINPLCTLILIIGSEMCFPCSNLYTARSMLP